LNDNLSFVKGSLFKNYSREANCITQQNN
jgi:hypothetical protein